MLVDLNAKKMFQISQTCFAPWQHILHTKAIARLPALKWKRESLLTILAVILSAVTVALAIVLEVEFNFEIKYSVYITICVFLSAWSCFKFAICISKLSENSLDNAVTQCNHDVVFTQKYSFDSFLIKAEHLVFNQGNKKKME